MRPKRAGRDHDLVGGDASVIELETGDEREEPIGAQLTLLHLACSEECERSLSAAVASLNL
jgi:hypothetical protein